MATEITGKGEYAVYFPTNKNNKTIALVTEPWRDNQEVSTITQEALQVFPNDQKIQQLYEQQQAQPANELMTPQKSVDVFNQTLKQKTSTNTISISDLLKKSQSNWSKVTEGIKGALIPGYNAILGAKNIQSAYDNYKLYTDPGYKYSSNYLLANIEDQKFQTNMRQDLMKSNISSLLKDTGDNRTIEQKLANYKHGDTGVDLSFVTNNLWNSIVSPVGSIIEDIGYNVNNPWLIKNGAGIADKVSYDFMRSNAGLEMLTAPGFLNGGYKDPTYYAGTVTQAIGSMATAVGAGVIGSLVGGPIGGVIGAGLGTYALEKGSSYQQYIQQGSSPNKASSASNVYAIPAAILEMTMGISPATFTNKIINSSVKQAIENVAKHPLYELAQTALSEGSEELLQQLTQNAVSDVMIKNQSLYKDLAESFVGGAIGGMALGGGNIAINQYNNSQRFDYRKTLQNKGLTNLFNPAQYTSKSSMPLTLQTKNKIDITQPITLNNLSEYRDYISELQDKIIKEKDQAKKQESAEALKALVLDYSQVVDLYKENFVGFKSDKNNYFNINLLQYNDGKYSYSLEAQSGNKIYDINMGQTLLDSRQEAITESHKLLDNFLNSIKQNKNVTRLKQRSDTLMNANVWNVKPDIVKMQSAVEQTKLPTNEQMDNMTPNQLMFGMNESNDAMNYQYINHIREYKKNKLSGEMTEETKSEINDLNDSANIMVQTQHNMWLDKMNDYIKYSGKILKKEGFKIDDAYMNYMQDLLFTKAIAKSFPNKNLKQISEILTNEYLKKLKNNQAEQKAWRNAYQWIDKIYGTNDFKKIELVKQFDINNANDPAIIQAQFESEFLQEMENGEAGFRVKGENGDVTGYKSTVPSWIPEDLRYTKLIKSVVNHIRKGTIPTTQKGIELYKEIESIINSNRVSNGFNLINQDLTPIELYDEQALIAKEEQYDKQIKREVEKLSSKKDINPNPAQAGGQQDQSPEQKPVIKENVSIERQAAIDYLQSKREMFRVEQEDPLYAEARKYKSAEEFVKYNTRRKVGDNIGDTDSHVSPGFDNTPIKEKLENGGDFSLLEVVKGHHNQPSDYFDAQVGPRYYSYNNQTGRESLLAIQSIMRAEKSGNIKGKTITAYRTVPKDVNVHTLKNGDWITFSKTYADDHGMSRFGDGEYKIIEQEVSPKHVWWDNNDINEWGYDTGNDLSKSQLTDIWNKANSEKFRTGDIIERKTGIKISDAQRAEIEKLNQELFGDNKVDYLERILTPQGQNALGVYRANMINILDGQADPKDTFYHEAIHKYMDLFGDMESRIDALEEVAKKNNLGTDMNAAEEILAENFIQYAKSREGFVGKLKQFFDKLLIQIQTVFSKPENISKIEKLYDDILGKKALELKERGFSKTAQKADWLNDVVKRNIQQMYSPLMNKNTMAEAQVVIEKDFGQAYKIALTGENTALNNGISMLMVGYLQENGRIDDAIDIAEKVAKQATEQGQANQILSLFSRLTPEGALRYATRLTQKYNEKRLTKNKIRVSKKQAQLIKQLAEDVNKETDKRKRELKSAKLLDAVQSIIPPGILHTISNIQTVAQLLNLKTAIRNILGNMMFMGIENVKDVSALPVDMVTSIFTKKRTKTLPDIVAQTKGFTKGFREGWEEAWAGVDTKQLNTQFEMKNYTKKGVLGFFNKLLDVTLKVSDRAFYQAAFEKELSNQLKIRNLKYPDVLSLEAAHYQGLYATFQDTNLLSKGFSGFKRFLNVNQEFGTGDLIMKYPKTPANILMRSIEYSPSNFVQPIMEMGKPLFGFEFNQRNFVDAFTRATMGSGMIGLGVFLASIGIIGGANDDDYDIDGVQKSLGIYDYQINVSSLKRFIASGLNPDAAGKQTGDIYVSYGWAQPMAIPLAIGANIYRNKGVGMDMASALLNGIDAGINTLAEQPLLSSLANSFQTGISGFVENVFTAVLAAPSSFVPTALNQLNQLKDNAPRETLDTNVFKQYLYNKTIAKIPYLSENLPAKYTVFGEPMERYQNNSNNLFNVLLNPSFVNELKSNKLGDEVLRLWETTGEKKQAPKSVGYYVMLGKEKHVFTGEERSQFQKYMGIRTVEEFNKLVDSNDFQKLDDTGKVKEMSDIITDIHAEAKEKFFGYVPSNKKKDTPKTAKQIISDINKWKKTQK